MRTRARPYALMGRAAIVLALLAGVYVVARETSLFALREVTIAGAPADLRVAIESRLSSLEGESLITLGPRDIEQLVESIPAVHAATVDRDFPHSLRIEVTPERAVGVLRRGDGAWLVAASGKVLERLERGTLRPLPRIWVPAEGPPPQPGDVLAPDEGASAVAALAAIPSSFPLRVESVRASAAGLVAVLAGDIELRLGDSREMGIKFAVAERVVHALGAGQARALAYIDVGVPERPVVAPKSQVVT